MRHLLARARSDAKPVPSFADRAREPSNLTDSLMASFGQVRFVRHCNAVAFCNAGHDDRPIWLISARSTAAGKTKSGLPCRRRRAKARRTTTGAARAAADLAQPASMIPASGSDLSAENPIGP